MKIRKGMKLVFKDRIEIVVKGSGDRINGMIVSDKREYSVDFIMRWMEMGFVRIE